MTSIIPDQPTAATAELQPRTARTIDALHAHAQSFEQIAAFLSANPDLPGFAIFGDYHVNVPLSTDPDPKAAVAAWTRRAIEAGATVETFSEAHYAGTRLHFGAFCIQAFARVEQVGEQVEVTVKRPEWTWSLGVEIPAHARHEQAEAVNV